MPELFLQGIGPFKEALIRLKPLTLFIGRNSMGKSFITRLILALNLSTPNFKSILQNVEEELGKKLPNVMNDIFQRIRIGLDVNDDLKDLARLLIKHFASGFESVVEQSLKDVFEVRSLKDITFRHSGQGRIEVKGKSALMSFEINGDELKLTGYNPDYEFLDAIRFSTPEPGRLRIELEYEEGLATVMDNVIFNPGELMMEFTLNVLASYVIYAFDYPLFTGDLYVFPDSRAGIVELTLRPYIRIEKMPIIERSFVWKTYDKITRDRKEAVLKALKEDEDLRKFLNELGCISIEIIERDLSSEIILEMWNGIRVPLYKAPSGIRESVIPALALALPLEAIPFEPIIIEEPEAHLHPTAQRILVRLIAKAVNKGMSIIMTTHSDYIVSVLNNLILLNRLSKEEVKALGFKDDYVIDPNVVSAYLLKAEGDYTIVEELKVTEYGIPEDEFENIVRELSDEREQILIKSLIRG